MSGDPPPRNPVVDACWRVVGVSSSSDRGEPAEPVYFWTERGARTRAAVHAERNPRDARPVVEYRDPADRGDPDAWRPVRSPLAADRIPEPGGRDYAGEAIATRAARRRPPLPR